MLVWIVNLLINRLRKREATALLTLNVLRVSNIWLFQSIYEFTTNERLLSSFILTKLKNFSMRFKLQPFPLYSQALFLCL